MNSNPFTLLIHSRAFWLAVGALVINALIAAFPALEPLKGQFDDILNALVALLIAKIGIEDVARKLGDAQVRAAAVQAKPVDDGDTRPFPVRGG